MTSLEFHSAFNANVGAGSILVRNLWWREGGWESIDQQGNKMMPTAADRDRETSRVIAPTKLREEEKGSSRSSLSCD